MFERLMEEVNSIMKRDPAARTRLEVLLCYPGLHAIILHKIAHRLWIYNLKLLARILSNLNRWFTGIEIHPAARIGKRVFIDHGHGVVIGETAVVGDDVTLYHGVTLGGTTLTKEIRHPQIGNHVIIGSGAQLLGPIRVGDNARIGANAVVVTDVQAGATMVGIPAKEAKAKVVRIVSSDEDFDAYGTPSGDMPDPAQKVIEDLKKEIRMLEKRIHELEEGHTSRISHRQER